MACGAAEVLEDATLPVSWYLFTLGPEDLPELGPSDHRVEVTVRVADLSTDLYDP